MHRLGGGLEAIDRGTEAGNGRHLRSMDAVEIQY